MDSFARSRALLYQYRQFSRKLRNLSVFSQKWTKKAALLSDSTRTHGFHRMFFHSRDSRVERNRRIEPKVFSFLHFGEEFFLWCRFYRLHVPTNVLVLYDS
jgi:hypothetical protein